jgi:hypothetical protein
MVASTGSAASASADPSTVRHNPTHPTPDSNLSGVQQVVYSQTTSCFQALPELHSFQVVHPLLPL